MATGDRFRIACLAAVALGGASWIPACGDGAVEPPPPDPPRATSVTVTPPTARLSALGATVQLSAQVLDQNGRPMAGAAVAWSSGSTAIATVDASGLVTACVAFAERNGHDHGDIGIGEWERGGHGGPGSERGRRVARGGHGGAGRHASAGRGGVRRESHMVEGAEFGWSSSDRYVVTVDASGLVTGLGQGTANITATAGEASGTSEITVNTHRRVGTGEHIWILYVSRFGLSAGAHRVDHASGTGSGRESA